MSTQLEKLYKQTSPKLTAALARLLGTHLFSQAEDIVQDTFAKAATVWNEQGLPDNPEAWLFTTAKHQAIDLLRRYKTNLQVNEHLKHQLQSEWTLSEMVDQAFDQHAINESFLSMVFLCCDESIKPQNRLPFILRYLCGLTLPAVSRALLISKETVKKRLQRTKKQIEPLTIDLPDAARKQSKLDSVHTVLYLLFNEGYYGPSDSVQVSINLCHEALTLSELLLQESATCNQDTLSLVALMYFHLARFDSRFDESAEMIALDKQDRSRWKQADIEAGEGFLRQAHALPKAIGRFYIEALIAQQHCKAETFSDTNWQRIAVLYQGLYTLTQSPLYAIQQAVALGYALHLDNAIQLVKSVMNHKLLEASHVPLATLAHLHAKRGDKELAYQYAKKATEIGGTEKEHRLMYQQIESLLSSPSPALDGPQP